MEKCCISCNTLLLISLLLLLGYEDPIFETKQKTDENYRNILENLLNRVSHKDKVNVMVATHNEETVMFALSK